MFYEYLYFCSNVCVSSSDKSIAKYFTDLSNWLDILSVLFTVLIVPFRFANIEFQWVFAAIAYILHSLRIFEYAVLMS